MRTDQDDLSAGVGEAPDRCARVEAVGDYELAYLLDASDEPSRPVSFAIAG
jgi:hypothetical protein